MEYKVVGVFVVEGSGWNTNKSKLDVGKKNVILLPTGFNFNPIPVQFLTFPPRTSCRFCA